MADFELTPTKPVAGKLWYGSTTCDICNVNIRGDLFDARTFSGRWATLCLTCFKIETSQHLGTGYGQHYKERQDGKWVKVAG
jgi:hypothetical protein